MLWWVFCVYVPTIASERAWFLRQIVDVLPIVDSWIVGGDFNNVQTFEDWCAASPLALPRIARSEQDAWDLFFFALAGADAWHVSSLARRPNSLQFSRGFHCSRVYCRKDWIASMLAIGLSLVVGWFLFDRARLC